MQPTDVVFPDAELWACEYLRAELATRPESYAEAFVGISVPAARQSHMVIVRRDGGPRLDAIREAARLTLRCWATTDQDATDLARLVRALLWRSPDGNPVLRVTDISGPSSVPDESRQPQRIFSVEVVLRGSVLPLDLNES